MPAAQKINHPMLSLPACGAGRSCVLLSSSKAPPTPDAKRLPVSASGGRTHWPGSFLTGSWAISLAGCAFDDGSHRPNRVRNENAPARAASPTRAPRPSRALMKPLPTPNCDESATQPTANTADPNAELARRIRAEYELVCYRIAEALARQRLRQLQVWIAATRDRAVRALPEEQRE